MIPRGTILFASPNDDLGQVEARAYINRYNLTRDDVRMFTSGNMVMLEARKDVELVE